MATTPNLQLTYLEDRQASAEASINDFLNLLDALVQPRVINDTTTAPPGSPADGDTYIVAATATGDWVGKEKQIAVWFSGWLFLSPREGWVTYDIAQDHYLYYDGTSWVDGVPVPILTDATRGSAGTAGRLIWNSDDTELNFDDGSNWLASGGAAVWTAT